MILKHLLEDLNRLVASGLIHSYAETGVQSIRYDAGSIAWESGDIADLESMVKDRESDITSLEKDLKAAEDLADEHERRADELERLLDEVKNEEDAGTTLRQYKERAEQAEANADKWRKGYNEWQSEVVAMRKRKGVEAGVVKYARAINELVHCAARGESVKDRAGELVALMKEVQ